MKKMDMKKPEDYVVKKKKWEGKEGKNQIQLGKIKRRQNFKD